MQRMEQSLLNVISISSCQTSKQLKVYVVIKVYLGKNLRPHHSSSNLACVTEISMITSFIGCDKKFHVSKVFLIVAYDIKMYMILFIS